MQMARFEIEMATIYDAQDARWADLTDEMKVTCERMNRKLISRCNALGIPAKFRPEYSSGWTYRGENFHNERRVELRKVAQNEAGQ
jgi:hypothetical protein